MGLALRLYEQLQEAPNEMARFRLVVNTIEELELGWPKPGEIARTSDVREAELRLQKEIKTVELSLQKEIKTVELSLQKEIKAVELGLQKEIEVVRKEIKTVELNLQKEIRATEVALRTAIHRQTLWVVGAVGAVVGLVRLLDWLLPA